MKAKSFPNGWTVLVPINDLYTFSFKNSTQFVNITYDLQVNELGPNDYLLLEHEFKNLPDHFKTVSNGQEENLEKLPEAGANKHGDWFFDEQGLSIEKVSLPKNDLCTNFKARLQNSLMFTELILYYFLF